MQKIIFLATPFFLIIFWLTTASVFLSACQPATNSLQALQPIPTPPLIPTSTFTPTPTSTPTHQPTNTSTSQPTATATTSLNPQVIQIPEGLVTHLAWSPDGKLLAVASTDGLYLYDVETLAEIKSWRPIAEENFVDDNWVESIAFSPDGSVLALSIRRNGLWLWRVAIEESPTHALEGHTHLVKSVSFSPNGKLLASGSQDGTVRLWNVADCDILSEKCGTLVRVIDEHENIVVGVAFSSDGELLASEGGDGTVRLWRVIDGTPVNILEGNLLPRQSITFSPNDRLLVLEALDRSVRLCHVADGALVYTLDLPEGRVINTAFSPNGNLLALALNNKMVQLRRVTDDELVGTLEHPNSVYSITFSPDGTLLASGDSEGTIRLWSITQQNLLAIQPDMMPDISSIQSKSCRAENLKDPQIILDPDNAIAYSDNLRLYEEGIRFHYESTTYTQIKFPNGDDGVFVTLATLKWGAYQFLYRISNEQFQLVDWGAGAGGLKQKDGDVVKADVEFVELFCDHTGQCKEFLKVTGMSHAGTGLFREFFQLIDINNDGIEVIFSGENFNINYGFEANYYQYQYIDLDNDGFKEIIKDGELCEHKYNEETKDYEKSNCDITREVYQFNGTKYEREPSFE